MIQAGQPQTGILTSFASPLPLLVIAPVASDDTQADSTGVMVELSIIQGNGTQPNSLADVPGVRTRARLIPEFAATDIFALKQRLTVRLEDESGKEQHLPLLGMSPDSTWTLAGSAFDKCMLRNRIATVLASRMLEANIPWNEMCEVIVRRGGVHQYQGIYLLSEFIQSDAPLSADTLRDLESAAVYRYPPLDPSIFAGTLAIRGSLEIVYPAVAGPQMESAIHRDISEIESNLFSSQAETFYKYQDSLDFDELVRTYLLNFALQNANKSNAYFLCKRPGERWAVLPAWRFDFILDNSPYPPHEVGEFNTTFPWFQRLVHDVEFLDAVKSMHLNFVRNGLSLDGWDQLVDETFAGMEPALERDWQRWKHIYVDSPQYSLTPGYDDLGNPLNRGATGIDQEIIKIKHLLRSRELLVKDDLAVHYDSDQLFSSDMKARRNGVLAGGFVLLLYLSVRQARRRF